MRLNPVQVPVRQKGGKGGLIGKIIGGVAGAVAAPFTGGSTLMAMPALMGAGSAVGGAVGGLADPAKAKGGEGVGLSALSGDPGFQAAALKETEMEMLKRPEFQGPQGEEFLQNVRTARQKAMERAQALKRGR